MVVSKDDSDKLVKDYGHNVFWKMESDHDLDDLAKELEED